jgi:hypothetical protein
VILTVLPRGSVRVLVVSVTLGFTFAVAAVTTGAASAAEASTGPAMS